VARQLKWLASAHQAAVVVINQVRTWLDIV
jgi:RecA/RadA recombinase